MNRYLGISGEGLGKRKQKKEGRSGGHDGRRREREREGYTPRTNKASIT